MKDELKNAGFPPGNTVTEKNYKILKELISNKNTVFNSISALHTKTKISYQFLKTHKEAICKLGITFQSKSIKEEIAELIKPLLKENNIVFKNHGELANTLNINRTRVTKHSKFLKGSGIIFDRKKGQKSIIIKKAEKLIEKGEMSFNSYTEFANRIGVSSSNIKAKLPELEALGFKISSKIFNKEDVLNRARELVINNDSYFHSNLALAKKLNIDMATAKKMKEEFIDLGISIRDRTNKKILLRKAQNLVEEGETEFPTFKALAERLKAGEGTISTYKTELLNLGLEIKKPYIDNDEMFNRAQKLIDNNENVVKSYVELAKKLIVNPNKVYKNIDKFIELGIKFEKDIREEELFKQAEKLIKKGVVVFDSVPHFAGRIGASKDIIHSRRDKFEEMGIKFLTSKGSTKISSYKKCINKIKESEIKIEDMYAFKEISKDFYGTTFNMEDKDIENIFSEEHTAQNFSIKEKENIVEKAIIDLEYLSEVEDFSLLELKYQILLNGYYLSEKSILNILLTLNLSQPTDSILKRLRLANKIAGTEHIEVIYSKNLPDINTSPNGSLIAKKEAADKLYLLWGEYVFYLLKNKLVSKSATRADISIEKDDSIESLTKRYPQLKMAFFFEDLFEDSFQSLDFNGFLALMLYCCPTKDTEERYRSLKAVLTGFFIYLSQKGLCLMHPDLFKFGGNEYLTMLCRSILKDSSISIAQEEFFTNKDLAPGTIKRFKNKNIKIHTFMLASSVNPNTNIKHISTEDIQAYCETTREKRPSGTINHEAYVLTLLKHSGNNNAIKKQKLFSLDEYFSLKLKEFQISTKVLNEHKDLIFNIKERTIRYRLEEESLSIGSITKSVTDCMMLLKFLDTFEEKPSGNDLKRTLNPIGTKNIKGTMYNWAILNRLEKSYKYAFSNFRLFFTNIDIEHEYHGAFLSTWIASKKSGERKLIRDGLDYPVYITLQSLSLEDPPETLEFPTKRISPSGESLDLSWWPHENTNPVIAIYNWLCTKLPRRSGNLLNLDVNSFLQYEKDGKFAGFFINTDKVQDKKAGNKFIPEYYIRLLFTKEELSLLENYVKYVKDAFSNYQPIKYKNGGNYEDIQPLFPDPEDNNVIRTSIKNGYYNKTMLKTQFKINKLAKNGELDYLYDIEELRESKINHLSSCKLLHKKNSTPAGTKIPETIEELEKYSLAIYSNRFTTIEGMHNLRHAGASSLLLNEGWSLLQIRAVTGHLSNDTLMNVYLHENEETLYRIETYSNKILSEHINEPRKGAGKYIKEALIPLFDSENPELIIKELESNGFMSLPRVVKDRIPEIYGTSIEQKKYKNNGNLIDDGIAIAAKFHPGSYEPLGFGMCTVGRRCPAESRGICSLCPHLIFTAAHIKAALGAVQGVTIHMALIEEKIKESLHGKKATSDVSNLQKQHVQKIEELMGWNEMINMINIRLSNNQPCEASNKKGLIPSEFQKTEDCFLAKKVTFDELKMEFLLNVKQLKNEDIFSDGIKGQMSFTLMTMALENDDKDTLKKLQRDSLDWFIEDYGNTAIEDRAKLLEKYIKENDDNLLEGKSNKLESKTKEDILEVEILT